MRRGKLAVVLGTVVVLVVAVIVAITGSSSKTSRLTTATPPATAGKATPASRSPSPVAKPTHLPPPTRTPGPTRPTLRTAGPATAPTGGPAAAACRLAPGVQTIAGRTVVVDLPSRFPAPVVIDFHGGNQSAAQEHAYTGLGPTGAAQGFVVVTPDGTGGLWNFSGTEPLPDDAAFTQAIASTLTAAGCSNGRLYTAGISDGADMAVAAACRVPAVRAVFAVAPSITPRGACTRKSYFEVHGTADPIVPYNGSAGGSFADTPSEPVNARLPFWTNGCAGPVTGTSPGAGTAVQRWTCSGGRVVELATVSGGGHTWPGAAGSEPVGGLGARASWNADVLALAFFIAH